MYKRLDEDARPMSCPLFSSPLASSPLPSSPASLEALANAVLEWGKIYGGEKGVRGGGISRQAGVGGSSECARAGEGSGRGGIVAVEAVAKGDHDVDEDKDVEGDDDKISTNNRGIQDDDHDDNRRGNGLPDGPLKTVNSDDATTTGNGGTYRSSRDDMSPEPKVASANKTESREVKTSPDGAAPSAAVAEKSSTLPISSSSSSAPLAPSSGSWSTDRFALEMQAPWAKRVLDGEKTVETRAYPLPAGLVGRWIELIESRAGRDGVSALGDVVEAGAPGLAAVGKVGCVCVMCHTARCTWARICMFFVCWVHDLSMNLTAHGYCSVLFCSLVVYELR